MKIKLILIIIALVIAACAKLQNKPTIKVEPNEVHKERAKQFLEPQNMTDDEFYKYIGVIEDRHKGKIEK